jgi:hypothetical protein
MPIIDDFTLKGFMDLFHGRSDRYGGIIEKPDGTKSGISNPGPVTEDHYTFHLEGRTNSNLGIYPLLDDATIWFGATDLDWHDEKKAGPPDFNIALKVRQAFIDLGMPAYIANSKSLKGYHIYVFFESPVLAADFRKIALEVLRKLDLKNTEIFPKQDKVDATVKYGNYINLPYFGDSPRKFLTADRKMIDLKTALPLIKRIDPKVVTDLAQKIVTQSTISDIEKELKAPKAQKIGKYPPCIATILKGVGQGVRDIVAFTLASHYLTDQHLSREDTLVYMERWNSRNTPPLPVKDLIEKINSATKGYDVGCGKIQNEPLLAGYCIGNGNCQYIQAVNKEKIKNGQIIQTSFFETETHLYEEIIMNGKPVFASYDLKTGLLMPVDRIDIQDGVTIQPFPIEKDGELYESRTVLRIVTLPTAVEDYGTKQDLINRLLEIVKEYVDLPEEDVLFCVYFILMTWVYDKLNVIPYLRFMGDIGSGKSTCLDVVGKLCYKPMMAAGAVTPAPIYRIIRKFGGTLILDESDMRFTDIESDITKILNCGIQRGRSVIRCYMDDQEKMIASPVFCPKVFSTRGSFTDKALESRCLTIQTEVTEKDLPIADGKAFLSRCEHLRNQLLVFRFRSFMKINGEDAINIKLEKLEPRLRQIARPMALIFEDDPAVMEEFKKWMAKRQKMLIDEKVESPAGHAVHALFRLAKTQGRCNVSIGAIGKMLTEDYKSEFKSTTIGKIFKSLKIPTKDKRHPVTVDGKVTSKVDKCVIWNPIFMRKILNTYFQPDEKKEYVDLLEPLSPNEGGFDGGPEQEGE